ncbi:glycosyl hydrolase family 18 protein [Kitasatospora sp. NPDC057965]|uniref:glycosyl hydrolase family 18 protein n=1 Tax=Kitasatospora sp. NPDC057965 TaxID=3346291 RepID=UPI0036DBE7E1
MTMQGLSGRTHRPGRRRIWGQLLGLALIAGLLQALLLPPEPASAVVDGRAMERRAVTFNAQGGNKWDFVRTALLKDADVVALQEVTTPPFELKPEADESIKDNVDDPAQHLWNGRGDPNLKYRLYTTEWGKSGSRQLNGRLYYLKILSKNLWGPNIAPPVGGDPEDEEDPDNQVPVQDNNTTKSMAIWLRDSAPVPIQDIKIITPPSPRRPLRWIRSRPALGIKVGGVWYFDLHAASIRTNTTPNPHSVDLMNAIEAEVGNEPWRALGDFNSTADSFRTRFPNTYYATDNGRWNGGSVPTQNSAGVALDYMVANHPITGLYVAKSPQSYSSDHYPVRFSEGRPPGGCTPPWDDVTAYGAAGPVGRAATTAGGAACEFRPPAIVSMGDSYISGEGGRWAGNALTKQEGDVWGTDRRSRCEPEQDCVYDATSYDFKGNRCDRSDVAPIKGTEYEDVPSERRFNIACSGATTKNILSDGFKNEKPQIQQLADLAAGHDIRMVVVSIGGNDLRFSDIMSTCARAFFMLDASCKHLEEERFAGELNGVRAEVVKTLNAIRATMSAAGQSDYRLVLQSYPSPLPAKDDFRYPQGVLFSDRYKKGGCPFLDVDAEWARTSVVPRITDMLRQAAGSVGAKFLNVQDAFAGHELCAKAAEQATDANSNGSPLPMAKAEWVRWVPYVPNLGWLSGTAQGDVQEAVHPNAFGQQALSRCLTEFGSVASDPKQYIFNCVGSGDGMSVTPDTSARREGIVRLVNTRTGEVLDDEGTKPDSYLLTRRDEAKPGQRWLLHNVGSKISLQSQRNGGFLERSYVTRWTYLAGAEAAWTVVPTEGDDTKVRLTRGDSPKCLTQDPGTDTATGKWVSVFGCSEDRMKDMQTWSIEYPDGNVVPPRDTDGGTSPREGQQMELRSAAGTAVDLSGGSTAAGTGIQAQEPDGSPAQRWVTRSLGGGAWRLAAAAAPEMVVDHNPGPHTTHLVRAQEGNTNQVWQIKGAGTGWYTLVSGTDGGCLTARGKGEALAVTACGVDDPAQRWKFRENGTGTETGTIRGLGDKCVEPRGGSRDDRTPVRLADCAGSDGQAWTVGTDGTLQSLAKCLDVDGGRSTNGTPVQLYTCNAGTAQQWIHTARQELKNPATGKCLDVPGADTTRPLQISECTGSPAQKWRLSARPVGQPEGGDAGDPFDASPDDRGTKPASAGDCRPEGMTPTPGVSARYCDVYDGAGREWVGNNRTRRVVGYFNGGRTGAGGAPKYVASNIPWSKVTHINYAFAGVQDNRISIGDPNDPANPATGLTWPGAKNAMDGALPYKGNFNLLNTYKKQHPAVKTLISVGGWEGTRNFYAMATNADGSVNQAGIDTFADSVTAFLDRYGFNGVDIDYEYPTALPNTGSPLDWDVSNPRRKGLQQGYNALMRTLRERLDRAGAASGRYYLLTSAGSSSGYLVRGLDAGQALQYQDYVNVMTYDLHGSWNKFVGPQAPLYDDGRDNELAAAGIYNDTAPDTKDYQKEGYFNVDWAYHYYRGALPAGRINLGIPYYSRGWRGVQGGTDGLWGTAAMPDQAQCPLGTGGRGPANAQSCGLGAVGIDNIWHDLENEREVGAGSNPLWHTKNLQDGRTPGYLRSYGVDTNLPSGVLTGTYTPKYSDALRASWLWNDTKKVFLSTENEQSLDAKARYIVDKGIGGAMIWELSGDYAQRPDGEWGMGYDLTTRLDNAFRGAGATGNTKAGGRPQPAEVIDVKAELVEFPTGENDFYPVQPKLRITNNTGVTLAQGTEISLDLPTSTPPVVKDNDYKPMKGLVPGHTGPNTGGLQGDFHRLTVTLGYCEDLAPGKSRDVDLKYYLPVTGPANVTFRIAGREFGSTGDQRRGVGTVTPPAPAAGSSCQAPDWQPGQVYRPDGGRLWRLYDKGAQGWMAEYGDSPAGKPMMIDNYPDQSRAHLVELMDQNPNQYWRFQDAGGGLYTVGSGGRCLTATAVRQDVASLPCDGRGEQKWRLVPIADNGSEGAPGAPRHNGLFKLRSAGGNDIEASGGATARGTHLLSGDPAASTAAFVKYQGSYWYAQWYTTATPGTAEANGGRPWKRLSPVP